MVIVPVVHGAEELTLRGMARRIRDISTRARSKQLNMDDISGGTFSLNNTNLALILGTPENNIALDGNVYVIVNGEAGATGSGSDVFAGLTASGDTFNVSDGYTFKVIYATDANGDGYQTGNDIAVELVSIPEPGTWASLLGGFGMLVVWQRSRRRRA